MRQPLIPILVVLFMTTLTAVGQTTVPDPKRDTLSPVYDWPALPFRWDEIRAGKFPLTPAHWVRHADSPVVRTGMNPRAYRWDDTTIRIYFGSRGSRPGIYFFDVDPKAPEKLKAQNGPARQLGPHSVRELRDAVPDVGAMIAMMAEMRRGVEGG